jgi:hypothetical protein
MGFTLVVLGDLEELWECRPHKVMKSYPYTLKFEARFHAARRYLRFSGNHDDAWESRLAVRRHLGPFFPEIVVEEGIRLIVRTPDGELGTLFLVHGHQGTTFSDRHRGIAKFFVRWVWRPIQRLIRRPSTTPARDFRLRAEHDRAMYKWALSRPGIVLVAGHTHRPVFLSKSHIRQMEEQLGAARRNLNSAGEPPELRRKVADLEAELEWIRAQEQQAPGETGELPEDLRPCYFNSGCCCFGDGDVTGLEIEGTTIRLVRWPDRDNRPRKEVLAEADLRTEVFEKL